MRRSIFIFLLLGLSSAIFSFSLSEGEHLRIQKQAYGSNCGLAGTDPILRNEMNLIIAAEDTVTLNKWLTHSELVRRAYAVEAFWNLQIQGMTINESQIELIRKIKKSKKNIWTCSGCMFMEQSLESALKEIWLKSER